MIFSADWYPEMPLNHWKLGAEIIIDKPLLPTYKKMVEAGIFISVHSPMNVSIGSTKGNVRYMSTDIICNQLQLLHEIQPNAASRIVVHAANYSDRKKAAVYEVQRKTLWSLYFKMKERNLLNGSLICLENLGKISQVGDVSEIIDLCKLTDYFIPCIDFGHLHGRSLGKFLNSKEDFLQVFEQLYSELPAWKVDSMHIHFSKLLYTDKGEKKHTTFDDKEAGPKPAHFVRALSDILKNRPSFSPVIVCESPAPYKDGHALMSNFFAREASIKTNS